MGINREGQEGATAVEYGIMVALIALAIVGAVFVLGGTLSDEYACVEQHVENLPGDPAGVGC